MTTQVRELDTGSRLLGPPLRRGERVRQVLSTLEWATSTPPPRHHFTSLPRIRSERPAFDLHHPDASPPG